MITSIFNKIAYSYEKIQGCELFYCNLQERNIILNNFNSWISLKDESIQRKGDFIKFINFEKKTVFVYFDRWEITETIGGPSPFPICYFDD